jgi:hypothetical protein
LYNFLAIRKTAIVTIGNRNHQRTFQDTVGTGTVPNGAKIRFFSIVILIVILILIPSHPHIGIKIKNKITIKTVNGA